MIINANKKKKYVHQINKKVGKENYNNENNNDVSHSYVHTMEKREKEKEGKQNTVLDYLLIQQPTLFVMREEENKIRRSAGDKDL
jgi:hypothetical protein